MKKIVMICALAVGVCACGVGRDESDIGKDSVSGIGSDGVVNPVPGSGLESPAPVSVNGAPANPIDTQNLQRRDTLR